MVRAGGAPLKRTPFPPISAISPGLADTISDRASDAARDRDGPPDRARLRAPDYKRRGEGVDGEFIRISIVTHAEPRGKILEGGKHRRIRDESREYILGWIFPSGNLQ